MTTYNDDPEVKTMREDIANRTWKLQAIRTVGTVASAALALAAFVFLPPGVGQIAAVAAMGASTLLVPLITTKEIERLKVDKEYLETRMNGRNMGEQWEGYSRYVGGVQPSGPAMYAAGQSQQRNNGRSS